MTRKKNQCLLALLVLFAFTGNAQSLSPQTASYNIDLRLDEIEKKISAKQQIIFKNPSSDTIASLQLHLYYNAFKNTQSTFYQDQDGISQFGNFEKEDDCTWSWMNVMSVTDEDGTELTQNMEFISPDDDNDLDQTVLSIPLSKPILPYATVVYDMEWKSKIPNVRARTGYNKDFYFFAQWFPKLGVYEPAGTRFAQKGGWNCHQYHAAGEYYADFGGYRVTMNVPSAYKVGASGELVEQNNYGNRNSWTFEVNDVIDFAWACSPKFRVIEDQWEDVKLQILTYDEHKDCGAKYCDIIKKAFSYLDQHVGKYPYPSFTLIDPPLHGLFTGGMEYPTLVTSINLCFLPKGLKTTATLTTHELIHQYFMQMVASHEAEEPWLDEGFTTYYEGRILDYYEGEKTSLLDWYGWRIGNGEYNRGEFFGKKNPKIADNTLHSWEYKHGGYNYVSYNKTAIWLKTLERIVGLPTMDEIMKTYFERWKFKHPCGNDFESIASKVVVNRHGNQFGEDLSWFFDQVIRSSDECDYHLASINNTKIPVPSGFLSDLQHCENTDFNNEAYTLSRVIVHRLGEVKLPVEVKINFADGTSKLEYWDGKDRSKDFSYRGNNEIISAEVDPDRKIYLDKNFLNNSLSVKHQRKGLLYHFHEFLRASQNVLESLTMLI